MLNQRPGLHPVAIHPLHLLPIRKIAVPHVGGPGSSFGQLQNASRPVTRKPQTSGAGRWKGGPRTGSDPGFLVARNFPQGSFLLIRCGVVSSISTVGKACAGPGREKGVYYTRKLSAAGGGLEGAGREGPEKPRNVFRIMDLIFCFNTVFPIQK